MCIRIELKKLIIRGPHFFFKVFDIKIKTINKQFFNFYKNEKKLNFLVNSRQYNFK